MKRVKILEYIRELKENYPNSPLVPQVVEDELTFTLKKGYKGIPINDISGADFEMLENIIEDLDTLSPENETVLTPYEIMDELEPYISEYMEVYVSEGSMEIKINAPLDSLFKGYLKEEIEIPKKVTSPMLKKEIIPKVKEFSKIAESVAENLLGK